MAKLRARSIALGYVLTAVVATMAIGFTPSTAVAQKMDVCMACTGCWYNNGWHCTECHIVACPPQ
jgi:hypothetical protein